MNDLNKEICTPILPIGFTPVLRSRGLGSHRCKVLLPAVSDNAIKVVVSAEALGCPASAAVGRSAKPAPDCCVAIEHPDARRPAAVAPDCGVVIGRLAASGGSAKPDLASGVTPDDNHKTEISVKMAVGNDVASCVESKTL